MYPSDADDDNSGNTVLLYCCLNAHPQEKSDWRDTAPAFVAEMQGMTAEASLKCLADMNVPAAEQLQVEREEARELQTASRKTLADASIFHRTNEGGRTFRERAIKGAGQAQSQDSWCLPPALLGGAPACKTAEARHLSDRSNGRGRVLVPPSVHEE